MTRRFARWLILPLALLLLCACGRENAEPSLPPEAAGRHFAAKHALLQYRKSVDAACFAEDRLVYVTTKTERRTYTREDGKTVESEYTFRPCFPQPPPAATPKNSPLLPNIRFNAPMRMLYGTMSIRSPPPPTAPCVCSPPARRSLSTPADGRSIC